jgi:hypothetical protein
MPFSTKTSSRCSFIVGLFSKNKGLPLPSIVGIIPTINSSIISALIKLSTRPPPPNK